MLKWTEVILSDLWLCLSPRLVSDLLRIIPTFLQFTQRGAHASALIRNNYKSWSNIEMVKNMPIQNSIFYWMIGIRLFYQDGIVHASLHISKSFFSYFYPVYFLRKMLFSTSVHFEIGGKETMRVLVEEDKSTCLHFANGLVMQSGIRIQTNIFGSLNTLAGYVTSH